MATQQSFRRAIPDGVFRAANSWLQPKATDRDVAFRERVMRSTLTIVGVLGLISFALNLFFFRGESALISYRTMHIVGLFGVVLAVILVARGHVLSAGWVVALTVLFGANAMLLLSRQETDLAGIVNSIIVYTFVPLVATLVLPRNLILPLSLLTVATHILSQFVVTIDAPVIEEFAANRQIPGVFLALMVEGLLLRQLRVEFDDRLASMRASMRQTELAKQEAEAARQRAELDRERAEEADKAKTQFLANMSHELRTPLNAIIGYDEVMLGGMVGTFTPKQTELLSRIQHNSRRLLSLINDVLDLSKIESGSVEVFLAPMSPRKITTDTVENLRSLAQNKQIELHVNVHESLPELVLGDANKIQQILVNLVSNAIKFTEEGRVTVRVEGSGRADWQFSVQDTGIGIKEEALALIFEPFKQADSSVTRTYRGTGLGLSISKRLAEIMGGSVEVVSEFGAGSTFTVTLPRMNVPEASIHKNGVELMKEGNTGNV